MDRGYGKHEAQRLIGRALRLAHVRHAQPRAAQRAKALFIMLPYSSGNNYRFVRKCLRKHKHIVSSLGHVGLSSSVQPNLFRLLYSVNWPSKWPTRHNMPDHGWLWVGSSLFTLMFIGSDLNKHPQCAKRVVKKPAL